MKENIEKYINQDLYNPNYLFHGTSRELEKLYHRHVFRRKLKDLINYIVVK